MTRSPKPSRNSSRYDPARHGPRRVVGPGFHERVYATVAEVPSGSVTTYGDVAARLGLASVARQVGYALAALPAGRSDVPWYRVVNARGEVSRRGDGTPSAEQCARLATEGVTLTEAGRVNEFADRRHDFGPRRSPNRR